MPTALMKITNESHLRTFENPEIEELVPIIYFYSIQPLIPLSHSILNNWLLVCNVWRMKWFQTLFWSLLTSNIEETPQSKLWFNIWSIHFGVPNIFSNLYNTYYIYIFMYDLAYWSPFHNLVFHRVTHPHFKDATDLLIRDPHRAAKLCEARQVGLEQSGGLEAYWRQVPWRNPDAPGRFWADCLGFINFITMACEKGEIQIGF